MSRWLHNRTHRHIDMISPDDASPGRINICHRRFPSKLKQVSWVPDGYTWGYAIDPSDEGLAEFFAAVKDPDALREWRKKAQEGTS